MDLKPIAFAFMGFFVFSCGRPVANSNSKVSILIERSADEAQSDQASGLVAALGTPPSQISEFDCLAVNVMGDGILDFENPQRNVRPDIDRYFSNATYCSYRGITSAPFFLSAGEKQIDLIVPTGDRRVIQIVGIVQGTTFRPCDSGRLAAPNEEDDSEYYVIDDARLNLQGDVSIPLANKFNGLTDAQKESRLTSCDAPTMNSLPNAPLGFHLSADDARFSGGSLTSAPIKMMSSNGVLADVPLTSEASGPTQGVYLNGHQTFQFVSGFLSVLLTANSSYSNIQNFSYFVVGRMVSAGTTKHPFFSLTSTAGSNSLAYSEFTGAKYLVGGFLYSTSCGTSGLQQLSAIETSFNSGVAADRSVLPNGSPTATCYPEEDPWIVQSVVHNLGTNSYRMFVNGQGNALLSRTALNKVLDYSNSKLRIGALTASGSTNHTLMNGGIAEVVFYRSALSDGQRVQAEKYLCAKYAINCNYQ